jgi:hypothetical protein
MYNEPAAPSGPSLAYRRPNASRSHTELPVRGTLQKNERIFTMASQTVNRHIHDLVDRVGGADQYYPPYLSS